MDTAFAVVTAKDVEDYVELHALVYNEAPWHDGWSVPVAKERFRGLAAAPRGRRRNDAMPEHRKGTTYLRPGSGNTPLALPLTEG